MVSLIVLTMVQCTFTILKKWALHPVVKLGFKSKQNKISHHILRPKSGHIYLMLTKKLRMDNKMYHK